MRNTCFRGEIYYADLGQGVGSEQSGNRPVVIIQNDKGNKYSPTVIVAALTSRRHLRNKLPTHCLVKAAYGLPVSSVILGEQLRTIDKRRLGKYIGKLPQEMLSELDNALAVSIGISKDS